MVKVEFNLLLIYNKNIRACYVDWTSDSKGKNEKQKNIYIEDGFLSIMMSQQF